MRSALPGVFSLPCHFSYPPEVFFRAIISEMFLEKAQKSARERTRAFFTHACVFILPCDTWLLRRFLPAIVARRLLAFLEFYMPEEVSHAGVQPHLHE